VQIEIGSNLTTVLVIGIVAVAYLVFTWMLTR
jgi:hypothetical protein